MKETTATTTTNNNGRLPIDSLIQIWSHLPLKSLFKFRSVSKLWNSSISSDPLLSSLRHHRHLLMSSQPLPPSSPSLSPSPSPLSSSASPLASSASPLSSSSSPLWAPPSPLGSSSWAPPSPKLLLFLLHTRNEPVKIPDRPLFISTRPVDEVIAHDKEPGLIRIRNGFTPYVDHTLDLLPSRGPVICVVSVDFFYLCNPSTQEFLRIPRGLNGNSTPPTQEYLQNPRGQNGNSTPCGFGYLSNDNRYVLATMWGPRCSVLEFGPGYASSATWQDITPDCPLPVEGFGVMVDGVFYWKVSANVTGDISNAFLVCLDVREEEYRVISYPEGNQNEVTLYDQLYLVEFKGSLCAIDNFSRPPRMEVWVLVKGEEGGFNWVRKYNIFISGMDRDMVYPFCDYDGENGGEMVLCNGTRSRLYCYNLRNRSIKQVYKTKHRTSDWLAVYTPGLFPLSMAE